MLNYFVAIVLAIIFWFLVQNFKFIEDGFKLGIRAAVARRDVEALKRINFNARALLVFLWGSLFYIAACIIKFVISWF